MHDEQTATIKNLAINPAEAKIQRVLATMPAAEVDRLVPGQDPEFKMVAEAIMAWYSLLQASGIIKPGKQVETVLASSMLVLGVLVKYAYALGLRRGRGIKHQATQRKPIRPRKRT